MIIALNDNAADGRDLSWIWDADTEALCSMSGEFVTFGTRAYDMALRLKYGGIENIEVIDGEDMSVLLDTVTSCHSSVILANYTAMMKIRKVLRHHFGGKEFWE